MDPTKWDLPFIAVVAALYVIVFLRTNGTYWLGRGMNAGGRHTRLNRFIDSPTFVRGEQLIARYGAPAVAVSFLTIGIQTMVNLAAGVARMPLRYYIPATLVGSLAWALLYATVGFVGFETLSLLWATSPTATVITIVAVCLAIVAFIVVRRRRFAATRRRI